MKVVFRRYKCRVESRLLSRKPYPGSKTETKASLEPGQKAESVVVINGRDPQNRQKDLDK